MPEVTVQIGGRSFTVACQAGEEEYLESAAAMLDQEASALVDQIGRIPENRMLLMAGLMLADRTAGLEDKLKIAEDQIEQARDTVEKLEARPAPPPETVEVAVLPPGLVDSLAELAARAESVADSVEEKSAG
ncbi:cell division protein ZapA [Litorisediminicola beolgyonensis]|uniref:Cell division protein ZapA n=1 Tax=Litorisediminicola beolgyonensis TaxID=1173614 RepID=A0ABW3ZLJ8_9RHOB